VAGQDADTPLVSVEVRHLGGALDRPAPGESGQPTIEASHLMWAVGVTPSPELTEAVRRDTDAVKAALADWHAGYDYYNAVEVSAPASAGAPGRLPQPTPEDQG
jgi:hypothetical protein